MECIRQFVIIVCICNGGGGWSEVPFCFVVWNSLFALMNEETMPIGVLGCKKCDKK